MRAACSKGKLEFKCFSISPVLNFEKTTVTNWYIFVIKLLYLSKCREKPYCLVVCTCTLNLMYMKVPFLKPNEDSWKTVQFYKFVSKTNVFDYSFICIFLGSVARQGEFGSCL